jgi:hypothetical protein
MGERVDASDGPGPGDGELLLVALPDGSVYRLPAAALEGFRVDRATEQLYREILVEPVEPGFEYGDDDAVTIRSASDVGPGGSFAAVLHRRAPGDR